MMDALLDIRGVIMDFGGLRAVDGVSLQVFPGEIVALIGPNGAGKTTLFNCMTGIYRPSGGEIRIDPTGKAGRRIDGLPPHRITALGLARTFQNIRLFNGMTALENVMLGHHCRTTTGLLGAIVHGPAARRQEQATIAAAYAMLERVGLAPYADEVAGNLSYGAQRRLEIARALATAPSLLLLDEPAAGMNPQETFELDELIVRIRDEHKVAILLIEHDMRLVMNISDRIYVLEYGKSIACGTPLEIRGNPRVIEAYLGEDGHA
ncbi:MAG: ABC transporter ATP-binding protein [Desulfuromonadales bacterium]|nr:ABC transporter ATP-binding protein [Desulfuromonadales bacterium]